MFERSLVESRGLDAGTQKWTALGSLTVQCAVAGLLIAIPLLRPEVLPMLSDAPRLSLPFPVKPPAEPVRVNTSATSSNSSMSARSAAPMMAATRTFVFPRPGETADGDAPTLVTDLRMTQGGAGSLGILNDAGSETGAHVSVVPARAIGPVKVSQGVSAGMLLAPIQPVYPAIAKAAGIQGAVVMEAVISKAGRIESLHVMSGPPMLRKAAMDAVQSARYVPYKLSGEAVDVQTTITVVFELRS
jgi:periplasmic protein TonB